MCVCVVYACCIQVYAYMYVYVYTTLTCILLESCLAKEVLVGKLLAMREGVDQADDDGT